MNVRQNKIAAFAALGLTGALALSACGNGGSNGGDTSGDGDPGQAVEGGLGELSGELAGAGASSMQTAQTTWTESFMGLAQAEGGDLQITYDSVGSGTGREQFLGGAVQYAGSDAPLDEDELEEAADVCQGGEAIDLPVYISPIAIVYNLEGVDDLNLSPEVIAEIFNGDITSWDDEKIAADNPDADLPDTDIVPVHRSDSSGTTENFTNYLVETAGDAWPHEESGDWPISGGQSGDGTSGLISVVEGGNGTIGYADAGQAGNLSIANLKVGENYVELSPEAAAQAVESSPREEGRGEHDIVVDLDRSIEDDGAYPLVLIAYMIVCDTYADQETADKVKGFTTYVISEDGQNAAAENAGSAPLSESLREDAQAAVDSISAAG
ncbi:MAG: phosphate ABC transporter substrate-binding protein PstS [Brachybacterium sp.]|nr:phosphate ABC transporter substrate-binding protein PstS [Brachybacterium sp.]